MISRAIVKKMHANGTCSISIPAMAGTVVDAFVCIQKGSSVYYNEGEVVFAAWLGDREWVILGVEYKGTPSSIDTLKTEHLIANSGELGNNIKLGTTGLTVGDLLKLRVGYSNLLSNILKDIND